MVERLHDGCAEVALDHGGRGGGRSTGGLQAGDTVALLVRPERTRLSTAPPPDPGPALAGHVTKIADLGFIVHYFVRVSERQDELAYRLNDVEHGATDRIEEGQRVYLSWDDTDARLFPAGGGTQSAGTPEAGPGTTRRQGA